MMATRWVVLSPPRALLAASLRLPSQCHPTSPPDRFSRQLSSPPLTWLAHSAVLAAILPPTRASARLASQASTPTPTSTPVSAQSTTIEDPDYEEEEEYDDNDEYQYLEEDFDLAFDVKDLKLNFDTGAKAAQLNLAITAVSAVSLAASADLLAEVAALPADFPGLGSANIRLFQNMPDSSSSVLLRRSTQRRLLSTEISFPSVSTASDI